MKEALKESYRILGLTATTDILKSIAEGENHYKDLKGFAAVSTITTRLQQLLNSNLIEHHLTKEGKRTEYYTLTERGEKVVKGIRYLDKVFLGEWGIL